MEEKREKIQFPMFYSRFANFGDLLNELLLERLFCLSVRQENYTTASLIGCGSIMDRLLDNSVLNNPDDIDRRVLALREQAIHVWGSGLMFHYPPGEQKALRSMVFHAVRGELTRKDMSEILGTEVKCVLGDPGLLASLAVPEEEKIWDYGIVPHFFDADDPVIMRMKKHYSNSLVINVRERPEIVVRQISQCRKIMSTSLHGLIVADSYRIPNCWCIASDKIQGDGYKYHDYFSAFGKDREAFDLRSGELPDPKHDFRLSFSSPEELERKQRELIDCFPKELIQKAKEQSADEARRRAVAPKLNVPVAPVEEVCSGVKNLGHVNEEIREAVQNGKYPLLCSLEGCNEILIKDLAQLRMESAYLMDELLVHPKYGLIRDDAIKFTVNNLIAVFRSNRDNLDKAELKEHYEWVRSYFHWHYFSTFSCGIVPGSYALTYLWYLTVRDIPYDQFKERYSCQPVISMTSYPARISCVAPVLKSVFAQTVQAQTIILWLSQEQFPGGETDLPEELQDMIRADRVEIRWCRNLGPHKKYFYITQDTPDVTLITIDDDALLTRYQTELLLLSYARHPECVSTMRGHFIPTDDNGVFPRYRDWVQCTDLILNQPSMQVFATGLSGVLYPPNCWVEKMLDEDVIQRVCPFTDDLWLKAMELVQNIPVVIAAPNNKPDYIVGSQKNALFWKNIECGNDSDLKKIINWIDEQYGTGFFQSRLSGSCDQNPYSGFSGSCNYISQHYQRKQQQNELQIDELNRTIEELNRNIGYQKKIIEQQKKDLDDIKTGPSFRIGRIITWLPRKVRGGVKCYAEHGFRYTVRRINEHLTGKA